MPGLVHRHGRADALDPGGTRVHRDPLLFRYGLGVAPFVRMANSVIFDPDFTDPNFPDMLAGGYALGTRISSNSWCAIPALRRPTRR